MEIVEKIEEVLMQYPFENDYKEERQLYPDLKKCLSGTIGNMGEVYVESQDYNRIKPVRAFGAEH